MSWWIRNDIFSKRVKNLYIFVCDFLYENQEKLGLKCPQKRGSSQATQAIRWYFCDENIHSFLSSSVKKSTVMEKCKEAGQKNHPRAVDFIHFVGSKLVLFTQPFFDAPSHTTRKHYHFTDFSFSFRWRHFHYVVARPPQPSTSLQGSFDSSRDFLSPFL